MPDPARDLRYARYIVERVLAQEQALEEVRDELTAVRNALGELGGDYLDGEEAAFAQIRAVDCRNLQCENFVAERKGE